MENAKSAITNLQCDEMYSIFVSQIESEQVIFLLYQSSHNYEMVS